MLIFVNKPLQKIMNLFSTAYIYILYTCNVKGLKGAEKMGTS